MTSSCCRRQLMTYVVVIAMVVMVDGYNLQPLANTRIYLPGSKKFAFSSSIAFHRYHNNTWLIVSSPARAPNRNGTGAGAAVVAKSSTKGVMTSRGGVYMCLVSEQNRAQLQPKCRKLNIDLRKRRSSSSSSRAPTSDVLYKCSFSRCGLIRWMDENLVWVKMVSGRDRNAYFALNGASIDKYKISGMAATPPLTANRACLRFKFSRYIGNLIVHIWTNRTGLVMVWYGSGLASSQWKDGHVSLYSQEEFQVVFEATTKFNSTAQIAVDDVIITDGLCLEDIDHKDQSSDVTIRSQEGFVLICSKTPLAASARGAGMVARRRSAIGNCYGLHGDMQTGNVSVFSPCFEEPTSDMQAVDLIVFIQSQGFLSNGTESNFEYVRNWIAVLLSSLPLGHVRVSIAAFGGKKVGAHVISRLSDYASVRTLNAALCSLDRDAMTSSPGRPAVEVADDELFGARNPRRAHSRKMALVVTMATTEAKHDILPTTAFLKNKGATVVIVGIGESKDRNILGSIASNSLRNNAFLLPSLRKLQRVRFTIRRIIAYTNNKAPPAVKGLNGISAAVAPSSGQVAIGMTELNGRSGSVALYPRMTSSSLAYLAGKFLNSSELVDSRATSGGLRAALQSAPTASVPGKSPRKKLTYFGSALSFGRYGTRDRMDLAVAAPKFGKNGSVFVMRDVNDVTSDPHIYAEYRNPQEASYFGFELVAIDMNDDGVDELFVSAPNYDDKYKNEGRVFIYSQGREIVLSGSNERQSHFGYAIANAGDLNLDGLNDVIIGAPSTEENKDGAVYVYNGDVTDIVKTRPSQVIRASAKLKVPILFGALLAAGYDLDGNGINDVAVGAPGSGRIYVLLAGPVFRITANLSLIGGSGGDVVNPWQQNRHNNNNRTEKLKLCFHVDGHAVPAITEITYELTADILMQKQKRATFEKRKNLIRIPYNVTTCQTLKLNFKKTIKDFSKHLLVGVKYALSRKTELEAKIINIHPDSTPYDLPSFRIPFKRRCYGPRCIADLSVHSNVTSVLGMGQIVTPSGVLKLIGRRTFRVDFYLKNFRGLASLGKVSVGFDANVIRLKKKQNSTSCMKMTHTSLDDTSGNVTLYYNQSIMRQNDECSFSLFFQLKRTFMGGRVNIESVASSASPEKVTKNNQHNLVFGILLLPDVHLIGYPERKHELLRYQRKRSGYQLEVRHSYLVLNSGKYGVPDVNIQVLMPFGEFSLVAAALRFNSTLQFKCHNSTNPAASMSQSSGPIRQQDQTMAEILRCSLHYLPADSVLLLDLQLTLGYSPGEDVMLTTSRISVASKVMLSTRLTFDNSLTHPFTIDAKVTSEYSNFSEPSTSGLREFPVWIYLILSLILILFLALIVQLVRHASISSCWKDGTFSITPHQHRREEIEMKTTTTAAATTPTGTNNNNNNTNNRSDHDSETDTLSIARSRGTGGGSYGCPEFSPYLPHRPTFTSFRKVT